MARFGSFGFREFGDSPKGYGIRKYNAFSDGNATRQLIPPVRGGRHLPLPVN